jgi:hypothetical protein
MLAGVSDLRLRGTLRIILHARNVANWSQQLSYSLLSHPPPYLVTHLTI